MRSVVVKLGIVFSCMCIGHSALQAQELPRRVLFGAAVTDDASGARITAITPGTPAATAGLRVGDILVRVGSDKIAGPPDFLRAVHAMHASTSIAVTYLRNGATTSSNLHLLQAPKESDPDVTTEYSSISVQGSLRRTLLSLPTGSAGKLPALLLIGGIGCYSVDNASDLHDPYRTLAHALSRAGVIVMRIEKAGIGDSQGGPCFDTDFASESESYKTGLDALLANPRVDTSKVFLFGHSIGTLIAPKLALEKPVSGIVVAEAVGINWFEYELANLRRQALLSGDSPPDTDALLRSKEECMHRLLVEKESERDIEARSPECKLRNTYPVGPSYMQQVAALNIAEPWTKLNVPVLAIYGTADFVTDKSDHQRIVDIVNAAHPGTAQLQTVDGMDHHLELMGTAQKAYDTRVKQHGQGPYAEQLSAIVRTWICTQASCVATR